MKMTHVDLSIASFREENSRARSPVRIFLFAPENARHLRMYAHVFPCARQNLRTKRSREENHVSTGGKSVEGKKIFRILFRRAGIFAPTPIAAELFCSFSEIRHTDSTVVLTPTCL
jgi:hypothetical protein